MEANSTGGQGSRRAVAPSDDDDVCRDSSVGAATRYQVDAPGIESRVGVRFSAPVQTGPGAYPASYTMGTVSLSQG